MPVEPDSEPNFKDYKFILSGTIEYDSNSSDFNEFKGILKLNKDPRAEILSNDNLLLKMSRVKNTNWIIGIIVYAGNRAKIMSKSKYLRNKYNFGLRVTNKFNYFMIFLVILLAMVTISFFPNNLSLFR